MNERIIDFLFIAKKTVYEGNGTEVKSSKPLSHDFEYTKEDFKLINSHLGNDNFSGQEVLCVNNIPVWSMNYVGRIIGPDFSCDFLKEALSLISKEKPFRGPREHKNSAYLYKCEIKGSIGWFYGFEEIFFNDIKVYEYAFHGGILK